MGSGRGAGGQTKPWKERNFNPFYDYECTSAYLCKNYAICCRSMPVRCLPQCDGEEASAARWAGGATHRRSQESRVESRVRQSQEPHRLNLASQSKVDGLVTVVAAAAKGQLRERKRERERRQARVKER